MQTSWAALEPVDPYPLLPKPTATPEQFPGLVRRGGRQKRVAIIGGGMAGLVAAYEFVKLDYQVLVLEKDKRTGGRVRTHRFQDEHGCRAEAGAMRLPANHFATLHYVREFDLRTRHFVNFNWEAFYRIGGIQSRIRDWPAASRYSPPDYWRNPWPSLRFKAEVTKLLSLLPRPLDLARTADLGKVEQLVQLSETSLRYALLKAGVSDESIDEMGHATGMKAYMHYSALEILAEYQAGFDVNMVELVDGMDAIPRELTRRLGDRVRLESTVHSIKVDSSGAQVRYSSPTGEELYDCDYIVCAIPSLDVVRDIKFEPELPTTQLNALRALSYSPASKTLVHVRKRFWEDTNGPRIFGGISYTDDPVSQFVYPSDNAKAVSEDDDEYEAAQVVGTGRVPQYALTRAIGTETGYYVGRSRQVSKGHGVLVAYRWGNAAGLYNNASWAVQERMTRDAVAAIHGGPASKHIIELEHVCWEEAFAHFMPGDHHQYQPELEVPYPSAQDPRVRWAGEHVGYLHAWIQSAVQTAWTAVAEIVQAPNRL